MTNAVEAMCETPRHSRAGPFKAINISPSHGSLCYCEESNSLQETERTEGGCYTCLNRAVTKTEASAFNQRPSAH